MNNAPKSGSASDTTMSVETPPEPSPAELTAVAELIAGGNPPPWLVEYLGAFICSVWLDRSVHKYAPTKTEMKKRLEAVERAANLIVSELQDANTSVFLEDVGLGDKVKNFEIQRTVGFLAVCASAASRSPAIAAPSGKTKAGRGDAKPIGAFSVHVYCALVIVEAWRHLHGHYPAPRNQKAARAAALFWKLSGGSRSGHSPDAAKSWRPHIANATSEPASTYLEQHRSQARHFLTQAAYQEVPLSGTQ